uniref:Ribosomal protein S4 n=1 Tax=Schizocladia ischiensis TaxID=196139 RepID=A0A7S6UA26_9STRA|nr:ribosomal protein S4 [Schizocladia ischiensis]QOW07617.1 ribosomal protein S4 [Schizocladia ischiensis]
MKSLKPKYKVCLRTRTNLWEDLAPLGEKSFHRPKWRNFLQSLKRGHRRRKTYKKHALIRAKSRVRKFFRIRSSFKYSLENRQRLKAFYGGLQDRKLNALCRSLWGKEKPRLALIRVLESRLDVNLYRLGFFSSIRASRQSISHGKIQVNGRKTSIASFSLSIGDFVEVSPKYQTSIRSSIQSKRRLSPTPSWIEVDYPSLSFIVLNSIDAKEVLYPFWLNADEILWSSTLGS